MTLQYDVQLFPAGLRFVVDAVTVLDAADAARDQAGVAANWAHVQRITPLHNGKMEFDKYWISDRPSRVRFTDGVRAAVHFVGFRDPQRVANAARLWGNPDFVHYVWDQRAQREIADGDVLVFADYDSAKPSEYNFDDSNEPNDPANWERSGSSYNQRKMPKFFPV